MLICWRRLNSAIVREIRPELAKIVHSQTLLEQQWPEVEIVKQIDSRNRRLAYQQGFFTKHYFYRSLEMWAHRIAEALSNNAFDTPLLTKIVFTVSDAQRSRLLKRLDAMNVNSRVLFPDVKGSVDYACFRIQHCYPPSTMAFHRSHIEHVDEAT